MSEAPAVAAPAVVKIKAPEHTPQIMPAQFKMAEFMRTTYVADVEAGVPPERLLDTDYWMHVAAGLSPWTRIEARAQDGLWFAEYIVLEAGRTWARVAALHVLKLSTGDVAESLAEHESEILKAMALFTVSHTPKGWRVVRVKDKMAIAEELGSKDSALAALREHVKDNLQALTTA